MADMKASQCPKEATSVVIGEKRNVILPQLNGELSQWQSRNRAESGKARKAPQPA